MVLWILFWTLVVLGLAAGGYVIVGSINGLGSLRTRELEIDYLLQSLALDESRARKFGA